MNCAFREQDNQRVEHSLSARFRLAGVHLAGVVVPSFGAAVARYASGVTYPVTPQPANGMPGTGTTTQFNKGRTNL